VPQVRIAAGAAEDVLERILADEDVGTALVADHTHSSAPFL